MESDDETDDEDEEEEEGEREFVSDLEDESDLEDMEDYEMNGAEVGYVLIQPPCRCADDSRSRSMDPTTMHLNCRTSKKDRKKTTRTRTIRTTSRSRKESGRQFHQPRRERAKHQHRSNEEVSLFAFPASTHSLIMMSLRSEGPRVEVEYEEETETLSAAQITSW